MMKLIIIWIWLFLSVNTGIKLHEKYPDYSWYYIVFASAAWPIWASSWAIKEAIDAEKVWK